MFELAWKLGVGNLQALNMIPMVIISTKIVITIILFLVIFDSRSDSNECLKAPLQNCSLRATVEIRLNMRVHLNFRCK